MTIQEITEHRIANQYISGSTLSPLALVTHMGAMQGQDYAGVLWSIGLRTGQTQQEILAAIARREIVRTWPQRGTLHIVCAKDAAWQVGLSADRLLRGVARRHEQLGLNEKILNKSNNVLTQALRGGNVLSRAKIMETLQKAGIPTEGGCVYHILWYLSQTGVLVAGPVEGKQQTFTLLAEWITRPTVLARQAGIDELTKRYFTSHGPATIQDFMWWSGLTSIDARAGLESNKKLLVSEQVGGKEYWLAKHSAPLSQTGRQAFLLPGFDEYLLGYKDRSAVLPAVHANKIIPGGNGVFLPTIITHGQVVGTWKKVIKKDHIQLLLSPFKKLSKADMQLLDVPRQHYSHFFGLPCVFV